MRADDESSMATAQLVVTAVFHPLTASTKELKPSSKKERSSVAKKTTLKKSNPDDQSKGGKRDNAVGTNRLCTDNTKQQKNSSPIAPPPREELCLAQNTNAITSLTATAASHQSATIDPQLPLQSPPPQSFSSSPLPGFELSESGNAHVADLETQLRRSDPSSYQTYLLTLKWVRVAQEALTLLRDECLITGGSGGGHGRVPMSSVLEMMHVPPSLVLFDSEEAAFVAV